MSSPPSAGVESLPKIAMHYAEHRKKTLTSDVNIPSPSVDYAKYISEGESLTSVASVSPDGRISVHLDLKDGTPDLRQDHAHDVEEFAIDKIEWKTCPNMNILIMIVGSRGDVQPYVALGKRLHQDGHRIRIATHETFRQFVTEAGLEFFCIGGNPQDLMSYMVKNPGLMPGFESLTNGDIAKKRKMLTEMIDGCWQSCYSPCPSSGRAFAADAIISNPPAFAHIHCAEALGIPLLLSFTMPWSPTVAFAHPLVNVTASNAGYRMSNYLSYAAADLLTWQGIGDIINTFRTTKLGLSPLNIRSGPGYVDRLKVPWSYCMSPALVPKPEDWKNHIDVVGFYFLDLATTYQAPPELVDFLNAGEPPVYIGFGSVVVDDPEALSKIVFDATKQAGVRALVSSGWGGLGGASVPPHIFMLGNVPHDWLFDKERVRAVVHHGGAGTTAIGLAKGRPTVVVPFFGDQAFWGSMIHKSGAGPKPIHHKDLTAEKLKCALAYAISPTAKEAASALAQKIYEENGVHKGVERFYKHLPLLNMRCDLDPSRLAVWWSPSHYLKLSAFAAQALADAKLLSIRSLVLHRPKEYKPRKPTMQSSGHAGAGALFWSLTHETRLGSALVSTMTKADNTINTAHDIVDAMASVHDGLRRSTHKNRKSEVPAGVSVEPKSKEKRKDSGLLDAIKNLVVHGKKAIPDLTLVTNPISVQGTWKMLKSSSGKTKYNRLRLTRIAEGRQAIRLSTELQIAYIIERFHAENVDTPSRQQLYIDAMADRGSMSMDSEAGHTHKSSLSLGGSTLRTVDTITEEPTSQNNTPSDIASENSISGLALVDPPQGPDDEDETSVFVREMELAIKLSLEEYERSRKTLAAQAS